MPAVVSVRGLSKSYRVFQRAPGLSAALKSLFRRRYEEKRAVSDLTFSIEAGERVGFLGPNGAGKTTTLKVLSGLLYPTAGEVTVAGYVPQRREVGFLRSITLVMGQKQQLLWDLPPADTFELNRAVYDIPAAEYKETLAELTELLDVGKVAKVPTRQLSLGERMKCELLAALLHRPKLLFLDEPTIGLDVSMQVTLREFVRRYNQRYEATLVLTSHYMDDVQVLCPRVIVIAEGRLVYDGDLQALARSLRPEKRISVRLSQAVPREELEKMGKVVQHSDAQAVLHVSHGELRTAAAHLLSDLPVIDLTVEDPPIEEVLRDLFARHKEAGAPASRGGDDGARP